MKKEKCLIKCRDKLNSNIDYKKTAAFTDLARASECKTRPMKRILLRLHTKVSAENKTTREGETK